MRTRIMGVLIISTQLVAGQSCIDWGHGMPYHCCVSVARRQLIITGLRLLRVSSSIKIVQLCFIPSCSNNHQGALLTMLYTHAHTQTHSPTHTKCSECFSNQCFCNQQHLQYFNISQPTSRRQLSCRCCRYLSTL